MSGLAENRKVSGRLLSGIGCAKYASIRVACQPEGVMRKALILTLATAAAIVLASCAPRIIWVKDKLNPGQMQQDLLECQYEARKAIAGNPSWMASAELPTLKAMCMEARGYTRTYQRNQ